MDELIMRLTESLMVVRKELQDLKISVAVLKVALAIQVAPADPKSYLLQLQELEKQAAPADQEEWKTDVAILRALNSWNPKPQS